jgi:hypothetical protein
MWVNYIRKKPNAHNFRHISFKNIVKDDTFELSKRGFQHHYTIKALDKNMIRCASISFKQHVLELQFPIPSNESSIRQLNMGVVPFRLQFLISYNLIDEYLENTFYYEWLFVFSANSMHAYIPHMSACKVWQQLIFWPNKICNLYINLVTVKLDPTF